MKRVGDPKYRSRSEQGRAQPTVDQGRLLEGINSASPAGVRMREVGANASLVSSASLQKFRSFWRMPPVGRLVFCAFVKTRRAPLCARAVCRNGAGPFSCFCLCFDLLVVSSRLLVGALRRRCNPGHICKSTLSHGPAKSLRRRAGGRAGVGMDGCG